MNFIDLKLYVSERSLIGYTRDSVLYISCKKTKVVIFMLFSPLFSHKNIVLEQITVKQSLKQAASIPNLSWLFIYHKFIRFQKFCLLKL